MLSGELHTGVLNDNDSMHSQAKVKVMKWYDYGYLEEIEVRREDQQLYKFKVGDFPRLHLHDIEDM
ncbi:hypothetical protein Tco_1544286, partial [Tanacetum coccineum]